MKYYKGRKGNTEEESVAFLDEFEKLKSIATEQKVEEKIGFKDICKPQKISQPQIELTYSTFNFQLIEKV